MNYDGLLLRFPKEIKYFIGIFVICLSLGYFTGVSFVYQTHSNTLDGVVENYLGNEEKPDAEVMKFKKEEREMLVIIHTHVLSMSFIFFLLGGIVLLTRLPTKIKLFLIIEPFISIVLTFGGIYYLRQGYLWIKYVVIFSGILMTLVFSIAVIIILYQLIFKLPDK